MKSAAHILTAHLLRRGNIDGAFSVAGKVTRELQQQPDLKKSSELKIYVNMAWSDRLMFYIHSWVCDWSS
jgi:hypothetical protein